jgi:hypothetical protein
MASASFSSHNHLMKTIELLQRVVPWNEPATTTNDSGYTLNIAGVYEDGVTQDWATQTCHCATQLARVGRVQNSWFNINSLGDPEIFSDAVCAALMADVIVVSVYAAEELPPGLYSWFEMWLARRPARGGALTALVGVAEPLDSHSARTFGYLQAVAHKGQLDFIPQERKCPVTFPASFHGLVTETSSAAGQAHQKLYGPRYDAYYHRGLYQTCELVKAAEAVPQDPVIKCARGYFTFFRRPVDIGWRRRN